MIRQILLDMDGVLADWTSPVLSLFDLDPVKVQNAWPAGIYDLAVVLIAFTRGRGLSLPEDLEGMQEEMWRRVHAGGAEFWANLEPLPWAHELYDMCARTARTTILTSPSKDPLSLAGKVRWLDKHFGGGDPFRSYLIGPEKVACASEGSVLIDDRDSMCEDFALAGGTSIVFPQPWNTGRGITPPVNHVRQILWTLRGTPPPDPREHDDD